MRSMFEDTQRFYCLQFHVFFFSFIKFQQLCNCLSYHSYIYTFNVRTIVYILSVNQNDYIIPLHSPFFSSLFCTIRLKVLKEYI